MSEGAQAISTPRQVQIQDRAEGSQQPVIDASADSLSPGMAPLGDVNGATGCMSDQLADVTEASCPTKSEGPPLRPHAAASALQGGVPQPPITSTCLTSLESGSSQEWNKLVAKALGGKYVKLASESLWQIRVLVYVRAKLREHITAVATSSVATGIGNVAGNKGGVGVALTYMAHTRLLFVNAHFQAHTHRVAGRQADYLRIKAGLFNNREEAGVEWAPYAVDQDAVTSPSRSPLSKADHTSPHTRLLRDETGSLSSSEGSFSLITSSFTQRLQQWAQPSMRDVADDYHVTIWLGDLNYRVETGGNRRVVDGVLKMTGLTEDERLNVLRNNDQLKKERELGKVFLGYKEGELTFPPTYKFDPGTDVYDSSGKSRVPSWCDRVLWRCNTDTVELLQYTHVPQLKVSDHRPVVATFLVHAQPAPQGMPREKGVSGMFHRLQKMCSIQ
ncbi:hypothetical protein WJX79_002592 [Trebouxia sp. C0005]